MACSCSIVANDNIFNRAVLGNDAFYFSDAQSIIDLLTKDINLVEYKQMEINNMTKIETIYNFNNIHEKLVELINK